MAYSLSGNRRWVENIGRRRGKHRPLPAGSPMLVLSLTSSEPDKMPTQFPICTTEGIAAVMSCDAKEHEIGIIHVQRPRRVHTP